jgi:hypothetical protein
VCQGLEVEGSHTVDSVRAQIQDKQGAILISNSDSASDSDDRDQLSSPLFAGKKLEAADGRTLAYYGVCKELTHRRRR